MSLGLVSSILLGVMEMRGLGVPGEALIRQAERGETMEVRIQGRDGDKMRNLKEGVT